MRKVTAVVLIVGAAVVGLSGCSSDDSSDTTTTTEESDSSSSLSFEVSTPEGQVSISLDGELPPGWPEDFPLPEDADAAGSGSLGGSSSGVMVGVYTTEESGKDAFDFYSGESSLEPSSESSAGGDSSFLGSMDIGGSYPGSVTVAEIGGTTYIVVVLTTDGASGSSPTSSTTSTTAAT
ncbi:MAG: hypothetical protein ACR2OH_10150 [Microthrixaceae bacterium]